MFRPTIPTLALAASLLFSGCITHSVQFDRASYTVPRADAAVATDSAINVVLSPATVAQTYTVHSFMTGIANNWNAQPGRMLEDVVNIELPQAFGPTQVVSAYAEPSHGTHRLVLELSIPHYVFTDFRAQIDVHATAYKPGRQVAFDKTYHGEGFTQGAKMFWGGAFAMKSAIRQSSLDAYKKIFAQLRPDIAAALAAP